MFLKRAAEVSIAAAANWLLTLLRSHKNMHLTREEFRFTHISFSQFGEDIAIVRWIRYLQTYEGREIYPFFVDAGAFHPIFASNTLLLRKQGWRGINIDIDAPEDRDVQSIPSRRHKYSCRVQ